MVQMNIFEGQGSGHRCTEWPCGQAGEGEVGANGESGTAVCMPRCVDS